MIDHLFRHQYGKMVSILTRIFGLQHLDTIEDAVQDTFVSALRTWQGKLPENPEAWLTKAAKNRTIDLFRKISAEDARINKLDAGVSTIAINELFLAHEIEDSVLRMIFTACNPALNAKDQLAFALKTISGFSGKEIASALLLKEETVKKRLVRARKAIQTKKILFEIPTGKKLPQRLHRVQEVIYLIFNEGFHSNRSEILIREELCGEAMRLSKILLSNSYTATTTSYALFALFCFQAARLASKIDRNQEIITLRDQDRSRWDKDLIALGDSAMNKAVETEVYSHYHYEAAIAGEHTQASSYDKTNWDKVLKWYKKLNELEDSPITQLNIAVVHLQCDDHPAAYTVLQQIDVDQLQQREYLYHGTYAEYFHQTGSHNQAQTHIDKAISLVENEAERKYLSKKKLKYQQSFSK